MNIGLGAKRKTVLLIDADAHARAVLRNALEASGFTVGEAANSHEGERTTVRIKPDAILADFAMETIDAGGTIAVKLRESGIRVPFYIVSNASDALFGAVSLHELGISGIFLKPVDTAIVIQTLKTRLGAN
jgi:two-component system, OmpR family, response regulator